MTDLSTVIASADTFNNFMTTGTVGAASPTGEWYTTSNCWPSSNSTVVYWGPQWWYGTHTETKTEQAFKIIRALMKAKVIEVRTLNQFFEAMDKVIEVL